MIPVTSPAPRLSLPPRITHSGATPTSSAYPENHSVAAASSQDIPGIRQTGPDRAAAPSCSGPVMGEDLVRGPRAGAQRAFHQAARLPAVCSPAKWTRPRAGQPFLGAAEGVQDRLNLPRLVGCGPAPDGWSPPRRAAPARSRTWPCPRAAARALRPRTASGRTRPARTRRPARRRSAGHPAPAPATTPGRRPGPAPPGPRPHDRPGLPGTRPSGPRTRPRPPPPARSHPVIPGQGTGRAEPHAAA